MNKHHKTPLLLHTVGPQERLRSKDAAAYLSVTVGTLRKWRWLKTGPPYTKLPEGRIYYLKEDLDAILKRGIRVEHPVHEKKPKVQQGDADG